MSDKLEFLLIDDSDKRKTICKIWNTKPLVNCNYYYVKDKDLLKLLENQEIPIQNADLIIIDHNLNKLLKNIPSSGSTYAEIIRERYAECPIISVTAVDINIDIRSQQKENYDAIFTDKQIITNFNTLISIAKSNLYLKNNIPKRIEEFLAMIYPPEDDFDRLETIIPENIMLSFGKQGLIFELSKWIRKTLFAKPGFLYDKLWASTMLGIKEDSFEKVEHFFTGAEYKGLYANNDDKRWWQTKLKEIIFSKFPETEEYLPWKLGHNLDSIENADHSLCHVCKKRFPEIVAYTDEKFGKRVQAHLKCSIPSRKSQKQLYLEEIRIIKEL